MRKLRFTESQIVAILKAADDGMKGRELCRKHGILDATYYKWKYRYGGMEASDLKRVREVEAENAKLKRALSEETTLSVGSMPSKVSEWKTISNTSRHRPRSPVLR